jgi:hypothetical protein
MWMCRKILFSAVCIHAVLLLTVLNAGAVTISDRAGGTMYWGGKYVNIKPSGYSDVIGRRSAVDQMEVIMNNDVVTVKITGPYFFNYVHNLKRTQQAPPGDLYISSQGWKVSGTPPYNKDIFEASEGWDYVVSFENKKVYKLNFSAIVMTSALPYVSRYRAQQAWRGGYGEAIDDAEVILTDKSLTFTFSVRNMALRSDIGVHWTMKCGNDIIEGSAALPPIAIASPLVPAFTEVVNADPADPFGAGDVIPVSMPMLGAASPDVLTASTIPGGVGAWGLVPGLAGAWFPIYHSDSDNSSAPQGPGGPPLVPGNPLHPEPYMPPDNPVHPEPYKPPDTPVPDPSTALLLLTGLVAISARKHLIK